MCNLHKLRGEFMDQFFASTKEKTEEYLGVEKAVDEGTFDVVLRKLVPLKGMKIYCFLAQICTKIITKLN